MVGVGVLLSAPVQALACAACFGKSDSAMAKGMNAGIFSMLAMVGVVLSGAASFMVFLARRSAKMTRDEAASPPAGEQSQSTPTPIE